MGWFGLGTAVCCCGSAAQNPCTLTEDNYNRANNTNIGSKWDEVAGGAEISGNVLLVNVNNSRIIATAANPDGPYTFVSVSITLGSSSSTARVFVGWADTSNYLYATVTTTSLTVGRQGGAGGSQSENVTIVPGTVYQLTLCFNGTQLIGTINGVQAMKDSLSAPGTKHGLGVGTASVTFDNFLARRVSQPCAECASTIPVRPCVYCQENEIAANWSVELSGIANDFCLDCDAWNGLWLFDNVHQEGSDVAGSCLHIVFSPGFPSICGGFTTQFGIGPAERDLSSGEYRSGVAIRTFIGSQDYQRWRTNWGATKVDCDGIDGLSLTLVDNDGSCTGGTCVIRRTI